MKDDFEALAKLSRDTSKFLRQLISHDGHTPDSTTQALHDALDHLSDLGGIRKISTPPDEAELNFDMRERDGKE